MSKLLHFYCAVACAFLVVFPAEATALLADMLIYDGVKSAVWAVSPGKLDLPYNEKVRDMAIAGSTCSSSLGSPRGRWRIAEGKLWLDGFRGCSTGHASISTIYGAPGPMWADWISSEVATYRGKTLCYGSWGEVGIAQTTLIFRVERGRIIEVIEKDNSLDPRIPDYKLLASYLQIQDPKFNEKEAEELSSNVSYCLQDAALQKSNPIAAYLAPTGTLRASIDMSNPVFAYRDKESGKIIGIYVDLAIALASDLRVPLQIVPAKTLDDSVSDIVRGEADFGFFPTGFINDEKIWTGRSLGQIAGYYTVRSDSGLTTNAQLDSDSVRIAVSQGSIYEQYLSSKLVRATVVRISDQTNVVQAFLDKNLTAAAGELFQREPAELRHLNLRVIEPPFMVRHLSLGVAVGTSRRDGEAVKAYLVDLERTFKSTLSSSISRHELSDVVTVDDYGPDR
jgi:polar amino acid transport system substrate-binding protein